MATTLAVRELSDAELIAGARKGDSDAYGELYRRHVNSGLAAARALTRSRTDADDVVSEAFARVLRALQSGGGPDVSFRPYLVTAVRNAFYDRIRRNREDPSDDMSDEVNVVLLDAAQTLEDGAFASAAYASLPERWQLVLWHTEVEGQSVAEVAPILGLAPNAVAALAYRAREGLRQAYLQAHLREQHIDECRQCAASLGAYVRDGLSARERKRTDSHLEKCESCSALLVELTETNNTLRAALIPALLGVSAGAYLTGVGGGGAVAWFGRLPKTSQAFVGGGAAAGAVAAVVGVAVLAGALSLPFSSSPRADSAPPITVDGFPSSSVDGAPTEPVVVPSSSEPTTSETSTTVPPATVPPGSVPPVTGPSVGVPPAPTLPTATTNPTTPTTVTPTTVTPTTVTPTTTVVAPPSISAVATQLSPAVANGQVRIEVAISNTGASPANGLRIDVPTPAGTAFASAEGRRTPPVVFVEAFAPGWTCSGSVSCTLPVLAAGQSTTLVLTFAIAASAPPSLTFTPAVIEPVDAIVDITPVTVRVASVPGLLATETARGTVHAIGNSVVTCSDLAPTCVPARAGNGIFLDHGLYPMQYVNVADASVNSSSATLTIRGTVARAFLVWGGDVQQTTSAPDPAARGSVVFTSPSGTRTVTADTVSDVGGGMYHAVADVSSFVAGSGLYVVAGVQTSLGLGSFGGWSLVVIEHNSAMPERFLVVAAPLAVLSTSTPVSFALELAQPLVKSSAMVAMAAFEGDRSLAGDRVSVNGFTITNPFDASGPLPRNPSYDNLFGTDVHNSEVGGLAGTQLIFEATTTDDRVMLSVVALAVDL